MDIRYDWQGMWRWNCVESSVSKSQGEEQDNTNWISQLSFHIEF